MVVMELLLTESPQQQQRQQNLRFPSQSPVRRLKGRRNNIYQEQQPWSLSGISVAAARVCLRYYPVLLTVTVTYFLAVSWSTLPMQNELAHIHAQSSAPLLKREHVQQEHKSLSTNTHESETEDQPPRPAALSTMQQQTQPASVTSIINDRKLRQQLIPVLNNEASASAKQSFSFRHGLNATQQQQQQRRTSYNAKQCPLLPLDYRPSKRHPIPVQFVMGQSLTTVDTSSATTSLATPWFLDGLEQSRYVQVMAVTYYHSPRHVWTAQLVVEAKQPNHNIMATTPMIWAVDWSSLQQDCHALLRVLESQQGATTTTTMLPPVSHRYLLLLDSSGSFRQNVTCHLQLLKYFGGEDKIRLAKRSIVQHRYWMNEDQWVHLGDIVPQRLIQNETGNVASGLRVLHMPLVVRDDIVELAYNLTTTAATTTRRRKTAAAAAAHHHGASGSRIMDYPVAAKRFADVTLFWRKGDFSHYGKLRRQVSEVIQSLNNKIYHGKRIRTLVKIFGDEDGIEQGIAQFDYVQQLLSTKIVVVTQRDEWEDQHGLLEAMACGALVMTDVMLSLPAGLVDGKHVVVYDSAKSLRNLILYYVHPRHEQKRLAIAKRGWQLAMGRHRSWHRMEELIFGKPLTGVDPPYKVTQRTTTKTSFRSRMFGADATL